jgi:hypothetical protein
MANLFQARAKVMIMNKLEEGQRGDERAILGDLWIPPTNLESDRRDRSSSSSASISLTFPC